MKVFVLIVSLISLISLFPGVSLGEVKRPDICYNHGECQEKLGVEYGQRCFIVKTGLSENGQITCSLQCYDMPLGSYCRSIRDEMFGICEKEYYSVPHFNPEFPDCSNAIDSPF